MLKQAQGQGLPAYPYMPTLSVFHLRAVKEKCGSLPPNVLLLFLETNCTSRQVPTYLATYLGTNLPTVIVVCHCPLSCLTSNTKFLSFGPNRARTGLFNVSTICLLNKPRKVHYAIWVLCLILRSISSEQTLHPIEANKQIFLVVLELFFPLLMFSPSFDSRT